MFFTEKEQGFTVRHCRCLHQEKFASKIVNGMSSLSWLILLVVLLTLLGTATLVFITVKYYWGERGTPPLTGEAKRLKLEEERRLRARQVELAEKNKWPIRPPNT
jgi:hypothetical protein